MGSRHDYAIKGKFFAFLGPGSSVLDCHWRENFFKLGNGFSFSWSRLAFFAKQCVATAPSNVNVVERNIERLRAGFELFTVVKCRFFFA